MTKQWGRSVRCRGLAWLLAGVVACTPDIAQQPSSAAGAIVVEFDPSVPIVPTPNDLAKDPATGKIRVPTSSTDSPAQIEFNQNYLGTLSGFPFETTAQVFLSGNLDPTSLSGTSVLAIDLTTSQPLTIAPGVASGRLVIPPPTGGWTRGHTIGLAVVGGAAGVRGANHESVIGSAAWALVSSEHSLVTCADLAAADCRPAVDVIPSTVSDPAGRLLDQTNKAIALEQLRRGLSPFLDTLAQSGAAARADIVVAWTFTVVDAGELTFDPAAGVIPFPNDALRTGPGGTVALPNPVTGQPLTTQDCPGTDLRVATACGLNTLDGFSTLAPLISENSASSGAAAQATLDERTVNRITVGLVRLASTAPPPEQTNPDWLPCLNCASSAGPQGPQTNPQELQWSLNAPLDERSTYLGYVTAGVQDTQGDSVIANPVFALLRLTHPLVDSQGKATVNVLTDAQAESLEPLRLLMAPALDGLEAAGTSRSDVALAFVFTTQSEVSVLDALNAYPASQSAIPSLPSAVADVTLPFKASLPADVPFESVGNVYEGSFTTPVAVTGPGGTLDVAHPKPLPVQFILALPRAAPATGAGITIFGHGFTRGRGDVVALADAVAATGHAVMAVDGLDHGDRTSCTGSKAAGLVSDDAACANPTVTRCDEDPLLGLCVLRDSAARAVCAPGLGAAGDGLCAAAGQGRCSIDGQCQGAGADLLRSATGIPVVSGWNIFSLTNFFATRDNFRQAVIDLAQLVRVIKSRDPAGLAARVTGLNAQDLLDPNHIDYVGQSLGSILGSLFNAVSPDTRNVVLNVSGGALPKIILDAPSFASQKTILLSTLGQIGITPGTPQFDQFIGTIQWILDPADPANVGYRLTHGVDAGSGLAPRAERNVLLQFIDGDETVPNVANLAEVVGANRTFLPTPPNFGCTPPLYCYEFTPSGDGFTADTATLASRHGFLLSPPLGGAGLAITSKAQTQVATFLATGSLP